MPLRSHVALVDSALRRPALRPLSPGLPSTHQRCRSSSAPAANPERIAVLGGGISGLASAYFVAKEFPKSVVTIFEAGSETGGWIRTKHVEVPGGTVAFESGPRTLRNAPVTGHLMQELDLVKDAVFTYKTTPGAMNRYIYYPDRLNRLPSTQEGIDFGRLFSLWRSGLFKGAWSILNERNVRSRPRALVDETIGSFWERRLDKNLANNILSSVVHGIYAGDIWQLSAKTLLSLPWQLEGRYGNLVMGVYKMVSGEGAGVGGPDNKPTMRLTHPQDAETWKAINSDIHLDPQLAQNLKDSAFFTFRNGLQQLVHRLQEEVEKNENIRIAVNTKVEDTKLVEGEETKVAVTTNTSSSVSDTQNYDLVISTLRNTSLTPYVTVMTVNLYYTNPLLNQENPGFGYLIPQSVPFEQNPERALGVIFDSSAVTGQDTASGTKFTVMLGGHYWDGWSAYPDEQEGLEMAKNIMQRHLGINDEPAAHAVNVHKDCIPQYTIGYEERLKDFAVGLSEQFKGRLRVVGNQVNGVGVNDCITAAWNLARGLRQGGWKSRSVGLDKHTEERDWVLVPRRDLEYKIKNQR